MKSYHKGHELDGLAKIWLDDDNVFFVWGAARSGSGFVKQYKDEICIQKIFDKDTKKQGGCIENIDVVMFEPKYMKRNTKIIICTNFYTEVKIELSGCGYRENIDFIEYAAFKQIWYYYTKNVILLPRVDLSITNKCTLRCEKCNMLMPYFRNPEHKDLKTIKQDLDVLFQWVDVVEDFMILGGEPLLYPNLVELLQYIKEHYQSKIKLLHMFTNGTCTIGEDLLKISEELSIVYDLSDYTVGLPQLRDRIDKFEAELKKGKIKVERKVQEYWQDFGYPEVNHKNYTEDERILHFHNCRAPFRGLYDRKLYYCHLEASAVQAGFMEESESCFVELDKLNRGNKVEIIELDRGYSKKGYPGFCLKCDGCESKKRIPVAKQWKRKI